jgi:hypothetical protein
MFYSREHFIVGAKVAFPTIWVKRNNMKECIENPVRTEIAWSERLCYIVRGGEGGLFTEHALIGPQAFPARPRVSPGYTLYSNVLVSTSAVGKSKGGVNGTALVSNKIGLLIPTVSSACTILYTYSIDETL